MALRDNFPESGESYVGGLSDGWKYETIFTGSSLEHAYGMIQAFLEEEGYDEIPLPSDAAELLLFKNPTRNRQIILFEDNGYVHNPIKILFHTRRKNTLILQVYNELFPDHLLKFHKIDR